MKRREGGMGREGEIYRRESERSGERKRGREERRERRGAEFIGVGIKKRPEGRSFATRKYVYNSLIRTNGSRTTAPVPNI